MQLGIANKINWKPIILYLQTHPDPYSFWQASTSRFCLHTYYYKYSDFGGRWINCLCWIWVKMPHFLISPWECDLQTSTSGIDLIFLKWMNELRTHLNVYLCILYYVHHILSRMYQEYLKKCQEGEKFFYITTVVVGTY